MIPFELAEPTSLAAAIKLLNPDDPTIRPIAGGTALMLMMKAGVFNPEKLISLRKIESKYSSISADASGLKLGAMTAHLMRSSSRGAVPNTCLGVSAPVSSSRGRSKCSSRRAWRRG